MSDLDDFQRFNELATPAAMREASAKWPKIPRVIIAPALALVVS
ncbi:hypothetical protein [Bradyrhizobium sp. STM 3566]